MNTIQLQKRLQEFIKSALRPLIVLIGPTASGKTAFSIEHASKISGVEIINADSRQLYKYLNVGTAKVTGDEMQGVPHHLLDVLDPKEEATAAWYQHAANKIIDDVHARGHVPMLVGGSMLYISAVIDDLKFPIEKDLRQSLQTRKNLKPREDVLMIGIERPREKIMQRINERTKQLFDQGWVEEVKELIRMGYTAENPAMKSHGYREIMEWIATGSPTLSELQEMIAAKTRQYAKRQITWWKHDPRIEWITPS